MNIGPYETEVSVTLSDPTDSSLQVCSEATEQLLELLLIPRKLREFQITYKDLQYSAVPFAESNGRDKGWSCKYRLYVCRDSNKTFLDSMSTQTEGLEGAALCENVQVQVSQPDGDVEIPTQSSGFDQLSASLFEDIESSITLGRLNLASNLKECNSTKCFIHDFQLQHTSLPKSKLSDVLKWSSNEKHFSIYDTVKLCDVVCDEFQSNNEGSRESQIQSCPGSSDIAPDASSDIAPDGSSDIAPDRPSDITLEDGPTDAAPDGNTPSEADLSSVSLFSREEQQMGDSQETICLDSPVKVQTKLVSSDNSSLALILSEDSEMDQSEPLDVGQPVNSSQSAEEDICSEAEQSLATSQSSYTSARSDRSEEYVSPQTSPNEPTLDLMDVLPASQGIRSEYDYLLSSLPDSL